MTFAAWLDVAAAARAALRRSRGLAQVLVRLKIELLFALGAAEVIRLPFVLGLSGGGSRLYVHTAHRVFHSCCAIHYDFSFVRELGSMTDHNVDWPVLATEYALPPASTSFRNRLRSAPVQSLTIAVQFLLSKSDHSRDRKSTRLN